MFPKCSGNAAALVKNKKKRTVSRECSGAGMSLLCADLGGACRTTKKGYVCDRVFEVRVREREFSSETP
jgi:hypothetical protein